MTKETAICKIHKENNIIHIQFNESAILKHSGLHEVYEYIDDMYGNEVLPKLMDVRAPLSIEERAILFLKDRNSREKMANQAILAGKDTNEEILKVFIGTHHKNAPLRIFTDYENAVDWLTSSEIKINKVS